MKERRLKKKKKKKKHSIFMNENVETKMESETRENDQPKKKKREMKHTKNCKNEKKKKRKKKSINDFINELIRRQQTIESEEKYKCFEPVENSLSWPYTTVHLPLHICENA